MNSDFLLDSTLARDCYLLGTLDENLLLLMDNALVPWFILVPRTRETELCDLPAAVRQALDTAVDSISHCLRLHWHVDKLNVAAIGNVVRQLHLHVIGRREGDYCWPGVVWGRQEREPYSERQVAEILRLVASVCGADFIAAENVTGN